MRPHPIVRFVLAAASVAAERILRNLIPEMIRKRIMLFVYPAVVFSLAGMAAVIVLLLTGPRMEVQPHLASYKPVSSAPAAQSIPIAGATLWPQTEFPQTPVETPSAAQGRIYYTYYCEFCHGPQGEGNGPVGASYVPRPADLRALDVSVWSDSALVRAMLRGDGHSLILNGTERPILERIVPPAHRPSLVLYVRSISHGEGVTGPHPEQKPLPPPARME